MWGKLTGGVSSALNKAAGGSNVDGLTGDALNDALDVAVDADAVLDLYSQAATSHDRATVLSCALERLVVAHTRVAERHVEQLLLAISTRQGERSERGDRNGDEIYQATNVLLACVQSQPNKDIVKKQSKTWLSNQADKMKEARDSRIRFSASSPVSKAGGSEKQGEDADPHLPTTSVQELIIQSLPDDADCLLSLIKVDSAHGFWVRYTVTQLLKELVAVDHLYPNDPFLNLLMRSTSGIGSIVEVLDDTSNDGILRTEGIQLLLAFATKVYSTTEYESQVQNLFTFENIFDRILSIVKDCGGSASQDIAHVATSKDCAQIVAWLVSSSRLAAGDSTKDADDAWAELEDEAGAVSGTTYGASNSSSRVAHINEKIISFFLQNDHVKGLVPLLQVPSTEGGKEVVLYGLQALDCVLRAALGVDVSGRASADVSVGKRRSKATTSAGDQDVLTQLVDPHTFRPSVVSSKVFGALCQLLPMHSMLSGARIQKYTDSNSSSDDLIPSVFLLQEVAQSIRMGELVERCGEEAADESLPRENSDEEALCLVLRCLLLVTEDCASGREHLLHPKSPVFPMLTAMVSSLPGKLKTAAISTDRKRISSARLSGHLALGLLLQLLIYLDGVRGTTPVSMLEMVINGVVDVLNTIGQEDHIGTLVPPVLNHRLIHLLLRLNAAVHSLENKVKVEMTAFGLLGKLIRRCENRLSSLVDTIAAIMGGKSNYSAFQVATTANYYLEALLLSLETYCHCFTHSESSSLVPLSLRDESEGLDIKGVMKVVLDLERTLQQLPSRSGADDDDSYSGASSRSVTSLLTSGSVGLVLIHSVQSAHAVTNTSGYTTPVVLPKKAESGHGHGDEEGSVSLVDEMEKSVFNVSGQDDWYSSAYYQLFHNTSVDSSAGSTMTSTTTATTATSAAIQGGSSSSLGGFLSSVTHNYSGCTPDGWLPLIEALSPDTTPETSGSLKNLMVPHASNGPFTTLCGPAKETVKRLCENSFAIYFSKRRAQFVQQMGEMRSRAGTMALTSDAQKYQRMFQESERKNKELTAEVDRLRVIVDEQATQISQLSEEQDSLCETLFETKRREQALIRVFRERDTKK